MKINAMKEWTSLALAALVLTACGDSPESGNEQVDNAQSSTAAAPDSSAEASPTTDNPAESIRSGPDLWPREVTPLPVKVSGSPRVIHYVFGAIQIDLDEYVDRYLKEGYLEQFDADIQEVWRILRNRGGNSTSLTDAHLNEFYPELTGDDKQQRADEIITAVDQIAAVAEALAAYEMVEVTQEAFRKNLIGDAQPPARRRSSTATERSRSSRGANERAERREQIKFQVVDQYFPEQLEKGWTPMGAALRSIQKNLYLRELTQRRVPGEPTHTSDPDVDFGAQLSGDQRFRSDILTLEVAESSLRNDILAPRHHEALDTASGLRSLGTYRRPLLQRMINESSEGK